MGGTAADAARSTALADIYRVAFESAAIGIAVIGGRRGRFLQVNRAFSRIVRIPAEDLIGKPWGTVTNVGSVRHGNHHMRLLRRGEANTVSYDTCYVAGDGAEIWARVSLAPIRDEAGEIESVLAQVEDVTDRVRAERAVAESETQFRHAFDSAVIGMVVLDVDGHFTNVNRAFADMAGRTPADLEGLKWASIVHPSDLAVTQQIADGLLRSEVSWIDGDVRLIGPDGNVIWCRAWGWALPEADGSIRRIVSHIENTTAKRRAEAALIEARDRAEEANRLKSEFLRNVSHEIRTPMSGVLGMVEMALDTTLTENQREYLDIARSSADHLLGLVNEILDLSKIEAGRMEPSLVEMNPADVVTEALRPFVAEARRSGLKLFTELDGGVPATAIGDPTWLGQIVANLVGNAIKFTDAGEVRVRLTPVSDEPGEATLLLSVADTGIGVPAELCDEVFQPFVQVDGSTTRRHGGTGLGLAITDRMVAALGGSITLSSEVGAGSTFLVTLPFNRPALAGSPALPRATQGLRMLALASDKKSGEKLLELLEKAGFRADVTRDVAIAATELAAARHGGPRYRALVIDTDYRLMPAEVWALAGADGVPIIAAGRNDAERPDWADGWLGIEADPGEACAVVTEVVGAQGRDGDLQIVLAEDDPPKASEADQLRSASDLDLPS